MKSSCRFLTFAEVSKEAFADCCSGNFTVAALNVYLLDIVRALKSYSCKHRVDDLEELKYILVVDCYSGWWDILYHV